MCQLLHVRPLVAIAIGGHLGQKPSLGVSLHMHCPVSRERLSFSDKTLNPSSQDCLQAHELGNRLLCFCLLIIGSGRSNICTKEGSCITFLSLRLIPRCRLASMMASRSCRRGSLHSRLCI